MLYPDFNDLVAFKDRKSDPLQTSRRAVKSIITGNHHSPFRGQGLEFDAVREYVPGDDIRNIDWRVTARMNAPHLKLFKQESERHVMICVDMNATMRFGTKNTFKSVQAARIAALLGWKAIAHQDRVSACLFGDVPKGIQFFSPKRTKNAFYAVLKMMSEPSPEHHVVTFETVLESLSQVTHTGSLIYLISDFMEVGPPLKENRLIHQLNQRCDLVFVSVNDPLDRSLYPLGTLGFCAGANEKIYLNTSQQTGKESYGDQWKKNRQLLKEITSRSKISMIEMTTESDIQRDLIVGLKGVARRRNS